LSLIDPEAVLVGEPGLMVDPRFLASLHMEIGRDLDADGAALALFQIGLLHGLRDAHRAVGSEPGPVGSASSSSLTPPLAIRFRSNPDASPPGSLEIQGTWPERAEASARLSALGCPASGRACWVSAGYTSGWLSGVFGSDIVALETTCSASGAESCRFLARELDAWSETTAADANHLEVPPLDGLPFAAFREMVASRELEAGNTPMVVDPQDAAVHIWGPVMVIPFSGADEALLALELIGRDAGAEGVSVVVVDLTGVVVDAAFGAAALEQIIERVDAWGIDVVLAGVSPLSEAVVHDLSHPPLMIQKDLHEAIAAAFQVADSQRRLL